MGRRAESLRRRPEKKSVEGERRDDERRGRKVSIEKAGDKRMRKEKRR